MRIRETAYMVTSVTEGRRSVFQVQASAQLLCDTLIQNRNEGRYLLHAFVVMPNHFLALLTPSSHMSLERCVQYIKGGSSKQLGRGPIWQKGFNQQGVQNREAYLAYVRYVDVMDGLIYEV
jgi:putative transposase